MANEYEAVSAVAKQYKANGISSIVVAEENYGEGSSRDQYRVCLPVESVYGSHQHIIRYIFQMPTET